MEISKEIILEKTHYGLNIYALVLRQYYPGATVLSLSGRDCKPAQNPFNADKSTLMVQIVNNCAVHYCSEKSISKGDAFDFAALHYNLIGYELYKKLNDELHLRIDKGVVILGSQNFDDYPDIDTRIAGIEMKWPAALINVMDAKNAAVTGEGIVNARGKFCWDKYWAMRAAGLNYYLV